MRPHLASCLTAVLLIEAPTIVHAQAVAIRELIGIERALSTMCRAWKGDEKHTDEVCAVRDRMGEALNKMGYCYGKEGQVGAEMDWHKCSQHSRR
jgi:hypothetical protein